MTEAIRTVEVMVTKGPHPGEGRCVIEGGVATADLPGLDGPCAVPAAVVPEWIAALVGLAPRPKVAAPGMLVTPRPSLESLLGPDPQAPAQWREILSTMGSSLAARWRVVAAPLGDIEILDCADAGLWAVQPCPPEAVGEDPDAPLISLTPTTSTTVWTWLTLLAAQFEHPDQESGLEETHGHSPQP